MASRFIAAAMALLLALTGIVPAALAGQIGTATVLELEQHRSETEDRVRGMLARDEVRDTLVAMGVDPAAAEERVAALTEEELHMVQEHLDELPAGGILALIGAVFVVLLILDLVGVTDVFGAI